MVPLVGLDGLAGAVAHAARVHLAALPSFDIVRALGSYSIVGMTVEDRADKQAQVRATLARTVARYPAVSLGSRLEGIFMVRQLWFGQSFYGGINTEDDARSS